MPPDLGLMSAIPLFAGTQRTPGVRDDASGHLAEGQEAWLTRIAVRSLGRIAIVAVHDIVRLEAEDNYVRIWADRTYLHKQTLTRLTARLVLANGDEITSGRSYRAAIQRAFGMGKPPLA